MKKKVEKKLTLNKITISDLNTKEKQIIRGGATLLAETCYCNTDHKSCSLKINCCPPPEEVMALYEAE